jgi:DNA-binding NarL/FixJ family response regulator
MRSDLTKREGEVLNAMSRGLCNKKIANELGLHVRTIEGYRERLKLKSGCTSTFQLAVWAVKRRYV